MRLNQIAPAVVVGALILTAYADMRATQRANVAQADAVLHALATMEGNEYAAQTIAGYQFRTDSGGNVAMRYADGWKYVRPGVRCATDSDCETFERAN